jgi:hypothetical protein
VHQSRNASTLAGKHGPFTLLEEEMMQDPGDSEHGLPPGPQPLLEAMLEQEKRADKSFMRHDGFGGVTILRVMIWIRDRIKRLRHGTGRQT